jgi:glycosyltransferase involved in cell wall biosynthesis
MSFNVGMIHADLPKESVKPGGVFIVVHELANALVRIGNYVRFYSYDPKPKDAIYDFVRIPELTNSRRINRRLVLPFQIGSLKLDGLDILHLHGDDWGFFNRTIPTVRTFHGCAFNEAKFADNLKAKFVHTAYHPLEILAGNLASFSVGVGDDTIEMLGANCVIPNGYDKELFYPAQKSPTPTAIIIGSLTGRKQAKLAIETLLTLRDELPNLTIHAVIEKPYDHPSVKSWIGISKTQLAQLVRESWIGVSTTLYEGFGLYYLEWMASGTVPITFGNIGVRSLICNSQSGIIAENLDELRAEAMNVLKDSTMREKYSKNSVLATQLLSWDSIAHQYTKVYSEVVEKCKI